MFWIENIFKFLGIILLCLTLIYYFWYFIVLPNDSRRARNTAILGTLLFITLFIGPCAYVNYNKVDAGYNQIKKETAQQITKAQKKAKETAKEVLRLKEILKNDRRDYDYLQFLFEQYRNRSINIDKNRLFAFFSNLMKELNSISISLKEKEILIIKLTNRSQYELNDPNRWEIFHQSLANIDQHAAFELGKRNYDSLYIALIRDQIAQLKNIAKTLAKDLLWLEKETRSLEEKSTELYTQVNDFLSVNIALK